MLLSLINQRDINTHCLFRLQGFFGPGTHSVPRHISSAFRHAHSTLYEILKIYSYYGLVTLQILIEIKTHVKVYRYCRRCIDFI